MATFSFVKESHVGLEWHNADQTMTKDSLLIKLFLKETFKVTLKCPSSPLEECRGAEDSYKSSSVRSSLITPVYLSGGETQPVMIQAWEGNSTHTWQIRTSAFHREA